MDPPMILKNLWRRKLRTLLSALGIAVGVAAVVALSAFGEGFATGFDKTFSSAGADLTVSQKDAIVAFLSALDDQVGLDIEAMKGVDEVVGTVIGLIQLTDAPYFIVKGEEPRGFAIKHYRLVEGELVSSRRQIMLGSTAAKNFAKKVGENIRLNDIAFRVVGIYETGVALEDGGAVIPLDDAQRAFDKRNQVSYFNVKVSDARQIDAVKRQIEESDENLLAARSGEATTQSEMLDMYRSFGWFLGVFAILVGGLGMMNTMLMSVFERTREIGVLRALGWRRRRIIGMILGEALVLALGGGALGLLLGVGLTQATRLSPAAASLLEGVFTPGIFVQALVVAVLLGGLGAIYPAWRASQLAPSEAMRYESGAGGSVGKRAQALMRLGGGALRNLWRRPTRTLVTVVGVGIGVGFIVALLAITEGFEKTFTRMASAGESDLMAEQANAADMTVSSIDERTADLIERRPEIKSVSKILLGTTTAPGLSFFMVFGLDPTEEYIQHYRLEEGRLVQRSREIILGRTAANGLEKKVGDTMRIAGSSFEIVGIYENGLVYEDTGGTMLLKDAQQMFGKARQASFLGIALHDPERADEVARQLEADYPKVMFTKPSGLTERMQDFATMNAVLDALVALTVVVGGIVMMNAMLMSVFERTQEIGVLRALGWRRRRVVEMVLIESLVLSLLSGLAGVAIGVSLNYLFLLEPTFGAFLEPSFSPELFGKVLVLALVLGALGGIYPAWRASGLRPIEALRYE